MARQMWKYVPSDDPSNGRLKWNSHKLLQYKLGRLAPATPACPRHIPGLVGSGMEAGLSCPENSDRGRAIQLPPLPTHLASGYNFCGGWLSDELALFC